MFLGNMFIVEITNHEVYIFRIIFVSLGALIFLVGLWHGRHQAYISTFPIGFKVSGPLPLVEAWFPTSGISLLSDRLRSGSRLITSQCSHMVHKLILHLNKLSIHLFYLLSQERNRIRNIVVGNLRPCFCLGMRLLKRFYF
jgi:hypothetical protein